MDKRNSGQMKKFVLYSKQIVYSYLQCEASKQAFCKTLSCFEIKEVNMQNVNTFQTVNACNTT